MVDQCLINFQGCIGFLTEVIQTELELVISSFSLIMHEYTIYFTYHYINSFNYYRNFTNKEILLFPFMHNSMTYLTN